MSKVGQIQAELEKLTPAEFKRVCDWPNDFAEDRLDFTPAFEEAIRQSEDEITAGVPPRVRRP